MDRPNGSAQEVAKTGRQHGLEYSLSFLAFEFHGLLHGFIYGNDDEVEYLLAILPVDFLIVDSQVEQERLAIDYGSDSAVAGRGFYALLFELLLQLLVLIFEVVQQVSKHRSRL